MRAVLFLALLVTLPVLAAEKQKSIGQPSIGWGPGSRTDEEARAIRLAEEAKAARKETIGGWRDVPNPAPGGSQLTKPVQPTALSQPEPSQEGSPPVTAMNPANPVSSSFAGDLIKQKVSESLGVSRAAVDWVAGMRLWPRLFELAQRPQFLTDMQTVMKSPRRPMWMWTQLGWVLLCLVLNWWRMEAARDRGFMRRLLERGIVTGIFVTGTFFVVPWSLFGDPWYRVFSGTAGAVLGI
ncbi:MAG TPA: hypothetical protein VM598_11475 [Bdellovibrionota bacterium]|nr:hypothetical protein [Bdellovibrionota bacterium]